MPEADPFENDHLFQTRDFFWFLTCCKAWRTNPWLVATAALIVVGLVSGLTALLAGGELLTFLQSLSIGATLALPFVSARAFMQMIGGSSSTRVQISTASDLACCDLSRQDLTDLQLRGRDLTSTRLTRSNLLAADLMGSLLMDVDLNRTIARRARFDFADLTEAVGHRADFRQSSLIGANFTDAIFDHADFRDAALCDATLQNCDLRSAMFDGADLQGADLRGADLRDADLRRCDLRSASIQGADLRGALLDGVDLTGLKMDDLTIWPDGQSPMLGTFELTDADLELLSAPAVGDDTE